METKEIIDALKASFSEYGFWCYFGSKHGLTPVELAVRLVEARKDLDEAIHHTFLMGWTEARAVALRERDVVDGVLAYYPKGLVDKARAIVNA